MNRTRRLWRSPITRLVTMAAVLVMLLGFAGYTSRTTAQAAGNNACQLESAQGNIKHVINVQFDNVHFSRDNPNVPSDLEQMPNLLNFIKQNGVLLSNHHTPLIAHTATDILTSLTGVYGDRMGVPVSNSFRYFNPDGTSNLGVSFAYWTDPIFDPTTSTPTDTKFNMLDKGGDNAPAPWVPYTRAGCNGMEATVSLSYIAAMQEHGVPVTYAYISDAHDNHVTDTAFGPGEAGYVAQLQAYDEAFGKFFDRLASDGINSSNTLFVFTADEGDHFVGGAPSPAGCDGVTVPCTYSQIGEINANMAGLLATEQGIITPFKVHSDSAPTVYITGNPARDNQTITRPFERAVGKLTAVNPMTNNTDTLTKSLADPVQMKILHMVTADPARTPTLTMFADPNYFLFAGAPNCTSPCVTQQPGFAWNHGDVSPDINTTWLGIVGPGIRAQGVNSSVWSDHTDIRPTMMELLGLRDDYSHDGRVLFEVMKDSALPKVIRQNRAFFTQLAQVYKQINADVGALGLTTLQISTTAMESQTPTERTYKNLENQLQSLNTARDALAGQIIATLEAAEFGGGNSDLSNQRLQQLTADGT